MMIIKKNDKLIVKDILDIYVKRISDVAENLSTHFKVLEENKYKWTDADKKDWELLAENLYFKRDYNINPDCLYIKNDILNNIREKYIEILNNEYNLSKKSILKTLEVLDIDFNKIHAVFLISLINIIRDWKEKDSIPTKTNFINKIMGMLSLNSENLFKDACSEIKDQNESIKKARSNIIFYQNKILENKNDIDSLNKLQDNEFILQSYYKSPMMIKLNNLLDDYNNRTKEIAYLLYEIGELAGYYKLKNLYTSRKAVITLDIEDTIYVHLLIYSITTNTRPPMVCKPVKYKSNTVNIYHGGYLQSLETEINIFNLIINKGDHLALKVNDEYVNNINYLTSIPLMINPTYINYLLNLPTEIINNLLETKINWNIISIADVIKNENETNYITRKETNEQWNRIISFAHTLYIAKIFSGISIYLIWTAESRGRIMSHNTPYSFYTTKLFRYMIIIIDKIHKHATDIIFDYNKLTPKTIFNLHEYINKEDSLYSIDATCSAYQIIGLLSNDIKMLKLTNVIDTDKKEDLYKYISDKIKDLIYKDIETIISLYTEGWDSIKSMDVLKFSTLYSIADFEIFIKGLDRKVWKHFIMTWAYNKSAIAMSNTLIEILCNNNKKINNITFNNCISKISWILIKILIKIMKKEFPNIQKLKNIIQKLSSLSTKYNKPLIIKYDHCTHYYIQAYKKEVIQRYYIPSRNCLSKTQKVLHLKEITDSISRKKSSIATFPNFIHYIDSSLLMYVLTKCRENKIPILTVHDCFHTNKNYLEIIKNFYKEAIIELFIHKNILKEIFDINILEYTNIIQNLEKDNTIQDFKKIKQDFEKSKQIILNQYDAIQPSNKTEYNEIIINKILKSKYILC